MRLELAISKLLLRLGISPHLSGYKFLREAIRLVYLDDNFLRKNVTVKLYPLIAEKFNTVPTRVERGIRHSIEVIFNNGDIDFLNEIFCYTISRKTGKVSNSVFISTIAEFIHLKEKIKYKDKNIKKKL